MTKRSVTNNNDTAITSHAKINSTQTKIFKTQIFKKLLAPILVLFSVLLYAHPSTPDLVADDPNIILFYISNSWKSLQRSMVDCNSLIDPKTHMSSILYLPANLPIPPAVQKLKKRCALTVKYLPKKINKLGDVDGDKLVPAGLLYLPNPYVVPGGMFNEMYGWDSYFIIRGLIEDNKIELARGIVENFFFEIEHYGGILNGNRTYYLSRTQLPFLAPIIRAIYEADQKHKRANRKWLRKAYSYAVKDYQLWTRPPHLAGTTHLSRYYDFGNGPVTEIGQTHSYYSEVARYFLLHPEISRPYLLQIGKDVTQDTTKTLFTISLCDQSEQKDKTLNKNAKVCNEVKKVGLTEGFYKGDRAMRESGFDVSFRFGPFSADTIDYAPVDLNSLLYKAEKDLAWMSKQLGKTKQEKIWEKRAKLRQDKITQYMWNEKRGIFFDYNFKTEQQSAHEYATTFYPLWALVATKAQAEKVAENLRLFEKPGGIVTSLRETGVQWDYPYGWAPIQLITAEGLYLYGFNEDANRISHKFLMMVLKNFMRDKTIREKYDVVAGTAQTNIRVGYKINVIGFGWTNGVFLVLLHKLPIEFAKKLLGINYSSATENK